MSRKLPYWTCPRCGSNIGHGERCDCEDGKCFRPRLSAEINPNLIPPTAPKLTKNIVAKKTIVTFKN